MAFTGTKADLGRNYTKELEAGRSIFPIAQAFLTQEAHQPFEATKPVCSSVHFPQPSLSFV